METIIHCTKKFETLKKILSDCAFRLKYCREVFCLADEISSSAVHPMVSFSKFDTKTIDNRNITYGKYGIGLRDNWVVKNKLHPVLYFDKNSNVANALSDLLRARRKKASVELAPHVRLAIMTIKCFTKNSVGYNSYFRINDFNFKSENEWRYVPTKSQIGGYHISKTKKVYEKKPDFYNDKISKFPLMFKMNDVEIIFVETEEQREEIASLFGINKKVIRLSKWTIDLRKATSFAA